MSDLEPKKRKQTKDSTLPTASFVRPEYNTHPNQQGNPPESNTLGQPMQQENGPPPSIIDRPDFSPSTSSSIHPFKLERFVDNKGNPRTRVYLGRLRYCINTFDVIIENDTTGATTYGSVGSTSTGDGTSHTHSAGNYLLPEHQHEGYNDSSSTGLTIPTHTHTQGGTAAAKTGGDITEGDTESGDAHTHATTGMSVTMADHYHKSGEESGTGTTAEGQQLKLRHHTHSLPNTTGGPTSGTGAGSGGAYTGADASHTHDLGGSTGDVDDFGVDDSGSLAPEDITGNTGGLGHTFPAQQFSGTISNESSHKHKYNKDDHSHTLSGQTGGVHDHSTAANKKVAGNTADVVPQSGALPPITGNSGSPSAHTHPLPDLSTSTSEADRFVCILGQPQGAGIISEVEPAGFTALKDSNDKDTVVKAKDLPIGDTYGSIFLKWKVILSDSDSLGLYSINAADVTIHRHSDPAKTAEQLIIDNSEKLTQLRGVNDENNPASGTDMDFFKRGSESEDDRTAYYYVKIGVSYDPNAAGTNSKTIEQMTYENVYWSPLFLSRYTGAIS